MNREELNKLDAKFYTFEDNELFDAIIPQIQAGALVLITGDPGTGKTTFCLQLISYLISKFPEFANHKIFSYEEAPELLRYHLDRLKITNLDLFEFNDAVLPSTPHILLLDSVDSWAAKKTSDNYPARKVADDLERIKTQHHLTLAIQHKTKAGLLTGSAKFNQIVDVRIDLIKNKKGQIFADVAKNRFGVTNKVELQHTSEGLILKPTLVDNLIKWVNNWRNS